MTKKQNHMKPAPRGSLQSAPPDATRPTCAVVVELVAGKPMDDEDITDMIDWFYVVEYSATVAAPSS